MIPDHINPNRAAPETYDRDWFLAQLNGRDPTAPRGTVAPVEPAFVETPVELAPIPAAVSPNPKASPVRYAGLLVGAGLGVLLVASAAFAVGGMPTPLSDPPAQAQPEGAPTAGSSATPNPQLTTFALPDEEAQQGDAARGRNDSLRSDPPQTGATTGPDGNPTESPSAHPTPTAEPPQNPTPTPTQTTPPDPDPTPEPPEDPSPTPEPTEDPSGVCELLPALC